MLDLKFVKEHLAEVKENIKIFIEAAKMRNEPLDHVLLYGASPLSATSIAKRSMISL